MYCRQFLGELTLVHGVNNKGNCDGWNDNSIKLWASTLIWEGHQCNRRSCKNNSDMHPGQEGSLVGKEYLGFHFDWRRPLLDDRWLRVLHNMFAVPSKQFVKKSNFFLLCCYHLPNECRLKIISKSVIVVVSLVAQMVHFRWTPCHKDWKNKKQ